MPRPDAFALPHPVAVSFALVATRNVRCFFVYSLSLVLKNCLRAIPSVDFPVAILEFDAEFLPAARGAGLSAADTFRVA